MPMRNRQPAICQRSWAKPVRAVVAPMPMKNTAIIVSRLQRSASQPAGRENAPKAMKPPVESTRISA